MATVLQRVKNKRLTAVQECESRMVFQFATEDSDRMTPKQLKMCLRAMGFNVAKGEARALVYEFDYTNTETIDLTDFQKIFLSKTLACGKHQQFEDAFRAMDRDEDGKISIRELNDSNTECKIDGEQLRHQIGLQYYDDDELEVVQDFLDETSRCRQSVDNLFISEAALAAFLRL